MTPVLGLIHYLWSRRLQFWADSPVYASRRPARRWVTPEWRAARLAGLASERRSPASPGASPLRSAAFPGPDTFSRSPS